MSKLMVQVKHKTEFVVVLNTVELEQFSVRLNQFFSAESLCDHAIGLKIHIGFSSLDFVLCLSYVYACVCVCVCDFLRERKISFHFLSCNGQTCFKFQWLKAKLDQPEYYNKMNENLSSWKDTIVKYVCFILQIYFSYLLKMNYSIYDCTIYVSI